MISILVLITLIFAILKLTSMITWAWWIILLPIWVPALVLFIIVYFSDRKYLI